MAFKGVCWILSSYSDSIKKCVCDLVSLALVFLLLFIYKNEMAFFSVLLNNYMLYVYYILHKNYIF